MSRSFSLSRSFGLWLSESLSHPPLAREGWVITKFEGGVTAKSHWDSNQFGSFVRISAGSERELFYICIPVGRKSDGIRLFIKALNEALKSQVGTVSAEKEIYSLWRAEASISQDLTDQMLWVERVEEGHLRFTSISSNLLGQDVTQTRYMERTNSMRGKRSLEGDEEKQPERKRPALARPELQCRTVPSVVSTVTLVTQTGVLNDVGLSRRPQSIPDGHCISIESGDEEWDIPRAHKKKKVKAPIPATSWDSIFDRLRERDECQRKSAKLSKTRVLEFNDYAILGDDVLITDGNVPRTYRDILAKHGHIDISRILAHEVKELRNKRVPLVKILWRNHVVEEATWETEESMKVQYPHLFSDNDSDDLLGVWAQFGPVGPAARVGSKGFRAVGSRLMGLDWRFGLSADRCATELVSEFATFSKQF
ncbi:unnamed protein product [Cuscuta campestris]|uniref:Chromo domain-containing protein n=1 Tax=Cuscuta campestris TaxID=132261 RepID=A0A484M6H2_9ASTE|nr:unnamed protein product [Cuscuta campestris]